jgi:hypothetical protein
MLARATGRFPTNSHSLVVTKVLATLLLLAHTPSTHQSRLATESASSGWRTLVFNASSAAKVWNNVRYPKYFSYAKLIGMTGSQAVPRLNSVDTPWMEHSLNTWYDFPLISRSRCSAQLGFLCCSCHAYPRESQQPGGGIFSLCGAY